MDSDSDPNHLALGRALDKSQEERGQYRIEVLGKWFVVNPGVFSPKYFGSPAFFAKVFPYCAGDSLLEVGCGVGLVSVFAALNCAKHVVATDINPAAVENCRENARLNGVETIVDCRVGDVFAPVARARFSKIFWNIPLGFTQKKDFSYLEQSVFDPGYSLAEKYFAGAARHLEPKGRLFLGYSSTLGRMDLLNEIAGRHGYSLKILAEFSKENYLSQSGGSASIPVVKFELFEAERITG